MYLYVPERFQPLPLTNQPPVSVTLEGVQGSSLRTRPGLRGKGTGSQELGRDRRVNHGLFSQ